MSHDAELDAALGFDPLSAAEKMTGHSYKDDDATTLAGLLLGMSNGEEKSRLLRARDDTTFSTRTRDYLRIAGDVGFRVVLEEGFAGDTYGSGDAPSPETLYVLFHDGYGVLLVFDTFRGSVNGGSFRANWTPSGQSGRSPFPMSHCWHDGTLAVSGDCREALRYHIGLLARGGAFVKPWRGAPLGLISHHMDYKGRTYDAVGEISNARLDALPADVREVVAVMRREERP